MTPTDLERLNAGLVAVTVWLTIDEVRAMAQWPDPDTVTADMAAVVASVSIACAEAGEVDA